MKEDKDFQNIGKRMTYKTPHGFFDQISEKTLRAAKLHEQNRKKSLFLWRSLAIAASMTGIALIGYYFTEQQTPPEKLVAMQKTKTDSIKEVQPILDQTKTQVVAEKKVIKSVVSTNKENENEAIDDVLADLTDDELLQMAAMFKTDQFMGESTQ